MKKVRKKLICPSNIVLHTNLIVILTEFYTYFIVLIYL